MSAERAGRLEALLAEEGLDALLVTNLVNVGYVTGFTGSNGACVVGAELRRFVTDFRYVEQAAAQVPDFDRRRADRSVLEGAVEGLSGRLGFDDDHLTVHQHARLSEHVGEGVELVPARGLVERLRAVKDEAEVQAIREAAAMADYLYEYVCRRGLVGRSERDVALDLEREMRERGAEDPSFPSIVAFGAHGALPHAEPRPEIIPPNTLVVIDMGCRLDGYCSDCTRTFATGPLSDDAAAVYELVLGAQQKALAAVAPGASGRDVDGVAREIIAAGGHGERFGHGLGHGVGREIHEAPRLSQRSEATLDAGNVVTVEPGVYVPGAFGVRIEDLVVVREGGPEVLSGFTKALVTLTS